MILAAFQGVAFRVDGINVKLMPSRLCLERSDCGLRNEANKMIGRNKINLHSNSFTVSMRC